jgi:hypothetical protein
MILNESSNIIECNFHESFLPIQVIMRLYIGLPLTIIGLLLNTFNICVFLHSTMRRQHVNWFLLALTISDTCLLICGFNMLTLPVIAEYTHTYLISLYLMRWSYPLGLTTQTLGVYLTITVSIHRYLGICYPFRMRVSGTSARVKAVIILCIAWSVAFNAIRWFELQLVPCTTSDEPSVIAMPHAFVRNDNYQVRWLI